MLLEFIEKVVVGLTILMVIAIAAVIGFSTFVAPIRHVGVYKAVIDSEIKMQKWLDSKRSKNLRGPINMELAPKTRRRPGQPLKPTITASPSRAKSRSGKASYLQPKPKDKVAYSSDYFSRDELFPDDERVRGIPWLRREYNVTYFRPQPIPPSLIDYYQSLEAATELIKEPRGRFEETVHGTSFTVSSIPKTSYLNTVVGLQAGDKILSVNGHKIMGVGFSAAKSIYDEIKGATKFAVKIERKGRVHVLSFTVKRR